MESRVLRRHILRHLCESESMWNDPIVEETRKQRDQYAARFGYDLAAMLRDLKAREQKGGRPLVSLPSRKPRDAASRTA